MDRSSSGTAGRGSPSRESSASCAALRSRPFSRDGGAHKGRRCVPQPRVPAARARTPCRRRRRVRRGRRPVRHGPGSPGRRTGGPSREPDSHRQHHRRSARREVGHLHARPSGGRRRRARRRTQIRDAQGPRQDRLALPPTAPRAPTPSTAPASSLGFQEFRQVAAPHQQRHVARRAARCRGPPCSPATWCSSTGRSSHVGIYIGNGKVVHASSPRAPGEDSPP